MSALTMENDMIQDHKHRDSGHRHSDSGHNHKLPRTVVHTGSSWGDENGSPSFLGSYYYTGSYVDSSRANIQTGYANIGNPSTGRHGGETRPTNMAVVWIMRIY